MKITWIGHACFSIEAEEGRIITDPFAEEIPYEFPEVAADLVMISHEHFDHNAAHRIPGDRSVVHGTGSFEIGGIPIEGIPGYHDDEGGAARGENILYAFTLESVRIAHLGDLGAPLDEAQREALADVDVLLIPVGGHYTIDARQAASLLDELPQVKLVIPMHFKTDVISDWPIETVEEFESLMDNVRRIGASAVELTRQSLPEQREVWILDHA